MSRTALLTLVTCILVSSCVQNKKGLAVLKSGSDTLDIRYDDYLDKQSWLLSAEKKTDTFTVLIQDTLKKRITFISAIDSMSFMVKAGDKYDFLISNGTRKYHTVIIGIADIYTPKNDSLALVNAQCLKTDQFSVAERNKNYPFNVATRIELISYLDPVTKETIAFPVKNGDLNRSKVQEEKLLDTGQINGLTNILFNIGRTPVPNLAYKMLSGGACYEPRNGILFFDAEGKIFEYVEICFACERHKFSSEQIKPWDDCEQKYNILRDFFARQGIRTGTVKNMH